MVDCQRYYIESGSLTTSGVAKEQTAFPYFDNYNDSDYIVFIEQS